MVYTVIWYKWFDEFGSYLLPSQPTRDVPPVDPLDTDDQLNLADLVVPNLEA